MPENKIYNMRNLIRNLIRNLVHAPQLSLTFMVSIGIGLTVIWISKFVNLDGFMKRLSDSIFPNPSDTMGLPLITVSMVISMFVMTGFVASMRAVQRSTLSDRELSSEFTRRQIFKIRARIEKEKDEKTAQILQEKETELQVKLEASFSDNLRDVDGNLLDDWRESLLMARRRLVVEGERLAARSSSNLTWGIFISTIVVVFLGVLIFIVQPNKDMKDVYLFWAYYGPRFSLVAVLQILASFFLRNFIRVEREIQRNKNEITNLELRLTAGLIVKGNTDLLGVLASRLIQEERNFVLAKKETSALVNNKDTISNALELAKIALDKVSK